MIVGKQVREVPGPSRAAVYCEGCGTAFALTFRDGRFRCHCCLDDCPGCDECWPRRKKLLDRA